jgi:probable HAF family extracellular repeat protein
MIWVLGRLVATVSLLAAAGGALAQGYTAVVVPTLPGGFSTVGYGVNDAGWVVGKADGNNGVVGFVYRDGVTEELPVLAGGFDGQANSVNTSGVIVGQCRNDQGVFRAVKWERDGNGEWQITDLGTLAPDNAGFSIATRINDAGQIVGYATTAVPGPSHGFLLSGGVKVDVGTLGWSGPLAFSQALGINGLGQVTGFAYRTLGGPEHGLLFAGDRATDITPVERFGLAQWHGVTDGGTLGGYISGNLTAGEFRPATYTESGGFVLLPMIDGLSGGYGYDINNSEAVVGTMFLLFENPADNIFRAFVSQGGITTDLTSVVAELPGTLTEARDIANSGMIVATANDGFAPSAVLLVPSIGCAADFNGDGTLDPDDLADFIACYFTEPPCPLADYSGDGTTDPDDLSDFIAAYFAGCT